MFRLSKPAIVAFYLFCASLWLGAAVLPLDAAQAGKVGAPPAADGLVVTDGPFTDSSTLERAWDRAMAEGAKMPASFWVGYSIERPAGEVEVIGSDSQRQENHAFLSRESGPSGRMGFLFRLRKGGAAATDVTRIKVDDLGVRLDLDGEPLLWLGAWPAADSLDFLEGLSAGLEPGLRKEIPQAVGLHPQSGDAAVERLVETARNDRSASQREEAVQGLGAMQRPVAVAALIDLARNAGSADTRREAVFQLGNQMSDEAVEALSTIVYEDVSVEVQKEALDALARSRVAGAKEAVTAVASKHPTASLRREARELLQRGAPR